MSLTHTVPNKSLDLWLTHGIHQACLTKAGDKFRISKIISLKEGV